MKTDIHTYGAAGLAGAAIFGFNLTTNGWESNGLTMSLGGLLLGLAIAHTVALLFPALDKKRDV